MGRTTERGFTEHEHLDELGIIHMNGRIYDPLVGRFLSADPFIQAPSMLQSYNRYAYVMNNPLNLTDPSGYSWWTDFRDDFVKPIVTAVIAYYTGGAVSGAFASASGGASTALGSWAVTGSAATFQLSVVGGALAGAAGGFVGGALSTGTLKGGVQGAFSGGVFGGIGATGAGGGWGTGEYVAAHAAGGCITSVASGGACGSGAASAAFGKFATLEAPQFNHFVADGVVAVVAGGIGSVIAGGKFENGATTAAYAYLFNQGFSRARALVHRDVKGHHYGTVDLVEKNFDKMKPEVRDYILNSPEAVTGRLPFYNSPNNPHRGSHPEYNSAVSDEFSKLSATRGGVENVTLQDTKQFILDIKNPYHSNPVISRTNNAVRRYILLNSIKETGIRGVVD